MSQISVSFPYGHLQIGDFGVRLVLTLWSEFRIPDFILFIRAETPVFGTKMGIGNRGFGTLTATHGTGSCIMLQVKQWIISVRSSCLSIPFHSRPLDLNHFSASDLALAALQPLRLTPRRLCGKALERTTPGPTIEVHSLCDRRKVRVRKGRPLLFRCSSISRFWRTGLRVLFFT